MGNLDAKQLPVPDSRASAMFFALLGACGSEGTTPPDGLFVQTRDGLMLEADHHRPEPAVANGGGAVLLHMSPSGDNDRSNFPPEFISALQGAGLQILNLNRRGVGGSAELARSAYEGPDGKWDAEAGVTYLLEQGVQQERVFLIGASNGSTSALDYAIFASAETALPLPAAMVFLSGGGYTENNNTIEDHRALLQEIPLLFLFSPTERGWNDRFTTNAPNSWSFVELERSAHGTRMLEELPTTTSSITRFLQEALP